MRYRDIRYQRRGDAAWITLDRPRVLNALRERTFEEICHAAERAAGERGLCAVVVTGAGDRAFSSGADVAALRELDAASGRRFLEQGVRALARLRTLPVPVVARIQGYCIGGGNELNLACDLAIATEESQFGQAPFAAGVLTTRLLPRLCGERFAKEVVFLCRRYSAREALARGWINFVVSRERLDDEVDAILGRLAEMSPGALRLAKASLNLEADRLLGTALSTDIEMLAQRFGSAEFRERLRALLDQARERPLTGRQI